MRGTLVACGLGCVLFTAPGYAAAPELDLDVRLEPATRELHVAARTIATGHWRFVLHPSLVVRDASRNGNATAFRALDQSSGGRQWQVVAQPGDVLRIKYFGILPALNTAIDHRGVLRPFGPMAGSAGSVLLASSNWYPALPERFRYRVTLSLPPDQRGLVAGRLDSETFPTSAEPRYRAQFSADFPADGIDLMAGPYSVHERSIDRPGRTRLRLRTYFTADIDDLSGAYLEDSLRYIERFSARVGAYPFDSFSVVSSPLPTGFGMPTLTYLGAAILRLPFVRATSLGHEVLHNWWGNGVVPDYASGNWSEGLTTFMADYAFKEDVSAQAARTMRLAWLRDLASLPTGAEQSLAEFRSRRHGAQAAIGYGKSAMVFLMLRDLIGTDAFEQGLRALWQNKRFKQASWQDLRDSFEKASGQDLQMFFAQWLNRVDAPTPRISTATVRSVEGKKVLQLAYVQDAPAYELRIPIGLNYPGRQELHWVDMRSASGIASIALKNIPDSVSPDPDFRVWRRLEAEDLPPILRQWILAGTPRLAVAGASPDVAAAAGALANAMFESRAGHVPAGELIVGKAPVLLVGLHADVDTVLAKFALLARPASIVGRGTAQVWTLAREAGRPPIAVISARDASALRALVRPLPHYGSQSYLAFEGRHAIERGVWPAPTRSIPVRR